MISESRNFLVIIKVRILKQQVIFLVSDGLDLGSFVGLIWGPGQNQEILLVLWLSKFPVDPYINLHTKTSFPLGTRFNYLGYHFRKKYGWWLENGGMKMSSFIPKAFNFGTNFCGGVKTISAICRRLRTTNLRWTAQTVLQEGSSLPSLSTQSSLPRSSLCISPNMFRRTEWKLVYHLSNLAASISPWTSLSNLFFLHHFYHWTPTTLLFLMFAFKLFSAALLPVNWHLPLADLCSCVWQNDL